MYIYIRNDIRSICYRLESYSYMYIYIFIYNIYIYSIIYVLYKISQKNYIQKKKKERKKRLIIS